VTETDNTTPDTWSSGRAFENGLVRVPKPKGGGWLLVAITGTHGAGEHSLWRGVVVCEGSEAKVSAEIARRTKG